MVHIKCVELTRFKSFGGTSTIPLLPGFTVVSGPNGSGKSNILDALLFALGLSSSKGMRAERLPDLVNHNKEHKGTVETSVTVTFDLTDIPDSEDEDNPIPGEEEWTVTRRLRVTKGGNYSSSYFINGEPSTATELHEQLNRLRIYPEGYNVVLQGDVTRIITMNSKERREIIDELAGVAAFDRKIERVRKTFEEVQEREERCHIIKQELTRSCDRLAADRIKAEKYQKLKAEIQEKQQWETVLIWRSLQYQEQELQEKIAAGEKKATKLQEELEKLEGEINEAQTELDELNRRVKALGEDEQLSVAAQLATQEAKQNQLQQRGEELATAKEQAEEEIVQLDKQIQQYRQSLGELEEEKSQQERDILPNLKQECDRAREVLEASREEANSLASASEAWIQEQTALTKAITALQKSLNPQRTEQARAEERYSQLENKIKEGEEFLGANSKEIEIRGEDVTNLATKVNNSQQNIQSLAQQLAAAEQERQLQEDTLNRLLKEQRDKQRQLDKLEATAQAQQEAQGSYATKAILKANLPGVCGLVAQLGQVDPHYQLALETAAGGRLGFVVVENDGVAAQGIEFLKQKRGGRATFLPLNKIKPPRMNQVVFLRNAPGFIDYAVELINFQPRYQNIFDYVFGNTVVFASLHDARPHIGKTRIVTLEGELLETSGAMSGGSSSFRSSFHFGTATLQESGELTALRKRLEEIAIILERCEAESQQKLSLAQELSKQLNEARQLHREEQLRQEQVEKEIKRLKQQQEQGQESLSQHKQELGELEQRLQVLTTEIPQQEADLQSKQESLAALEESQSHSEWQVMRKAIKEQEKNLQEKEQVLRKTEERLKDLANQEQRLAEKIQESQDRTTEVNQQKLKIESKQVEIKEGIVAVTEEIAATQKLLSQLSTKLVAAKQIRDEWEEKLRSLQLKQQKKTWSSQKLQETQQEQRDLLQELQEKVAAQEAELPNPLPEIPFLVDPQGEGGISFANVTEQLEKLQKDLRNSGKRLQAMEPVNMLALEEYERTQTRLQELTDKLATLEAERTELLLRIENFTTLRLRAFKEAFDAVNENFQNIFATLSDGDGYLQLNDPEDPFSGGLNLVAHPKGKPVQRLSSMSGGEKSLTALSFIFALQRYRPSPFYAFDEVDMFLDGANVERLARMIKKQAQQAQFIVVSLRRPMIESSERTIGVTQARGAYTQVLGIKL